MKRSIFTLIGAAFMIVALNGQITLTAKTHGFRIGDSHDFLLMKNVSEGIAGSNVIWDFTGLEVTDRTLTSHMLSNDITQNTSSIPNSNFALEEFGNHFLFKVTDDKMVQYGAVSCNTVTIYDKPFLKLKFPLGYRDQVSGYYSGYQLTGTSKIPVQGSYSIEADAYGTLLLPGNIELGDVLRVKQTRSIQNENGSEIYEITYRWYSADVRYPILVVTKYVLPEQSYTSQTAMYAHVENQKKSTTGIAAVESITGFNVYPNPYEDNLTINYELNKPGKVKIELYDVTGKLYKTVLNSEMQDGGSRTLTLEGSDTGNKPGIFYVRVSVDQKAYIKKVIKL
jgi:hypothetical protein